MEKYVPLFEITPEILSLSTIISEKITKLDNFNNRVVRKLKANKKGIYIK